MRISLAQLDLQWENPDANLERLHEKIDQFGVGDLLILPELWACGFSMNPKCHEICQGVDEFVGRLARENHAWVIAGIAEWDSIIQGQENRLVLFDRQGNRQGHYAKQKLFTYSGENQHYAAGRNDVIWNVEGLRIAPFICYELRFPELVRQRGPQADLLVFSANWPAPRIGHWDRLLPARAIENLAYVVAVNRVGQDGNGWSFPGHSVGYSPSGDLLGYGDTHETIVQIEVDPREVSTIRTTLPFLEDMD